MLSRGLFNNGGSLNVQHSLVSGNVANGTSGSGGGLFSVGGTLNLDTSVVSANIANRAGGGIEVIDGNVNLNSVVLGGTAALAGNIAGPGGAANPGNGGGLHVSAIADVDVVGGAVSNNRAGREGGGLWNQSGSRLDVSGETVISNNIASGNAADDGGGGIFNNDCIVTVRDSKLVNNDADGTSGSGGGVFNNGGTFTSSNSVIANNDATRAGGGIEVITERVTLSQVNLFAGPPRPQHDR